MPRSSATLEPEEEVEAPRAAKSGAAKPMSAREAASLHDDLAELIMDAGDYADQGLSYVNANKAKPDIWAFDEEEASKLADVWLSRAKKSAQAAASVRYVLSQWAYVQVSVMLFGRFVETSVFLADNGGFVAPAFVSNIAPKRKRAQTPPPMPQASQQAPQQAPYNAASAATRSSGVSVPASAARTPGASVRSPGAASSRLEAEEAQRAHMARVAALRDGAGTAAASVEETRPDNAPESAPPPPDLTALDGVEVSA